MHTAILGAAIFWSIASGSEGNTLTSSYHDGFAEICRSEGDSTGKVKVAVSLLVLDPNKNPQPPSSSPAITQVGYLGVTFHF